MALEAKNRVFWPTDPGTCESCDGEILFLGFWVNQTDDEEPGAVVCKDCLGDYLEAHWLECNKPKGESCDFCKTYELLYLVESR